MQIGEIYFIQANAVISDGDKSIAVKAQAGVQPNKKGMDIAQSFGASSSYARKYALNGLFLIDDTKDADAMNTHEDEEETLDNKPWLQKNTPQFENAKKALADGFKITDIRKKYKVSKEVANLLIT
jgi:carbonic anhydrase/acetyltransferase-like protein (isoleucine patch superfamily)